MRQILDGNGAATEALRLARVGVISAYPITPQSPIAERLSDYTADGTLNARYIRVESEHTALSAAIGAQLTGVRAATATSSVGLALMHEVMGVASGCRVPIVMPLVNRALVAPWSLWCDHQDAMAERDSGWLQFYAEDAQEVLDFLLMTYKLAEHEDVLLPGMVCFDGFFVSHSMQTVDVPDQRDVDAFLPPYEAKNLFLDPREPMFINNLTSPDEFSEMRFQQKVAFEHALTLLPQIQTDFYTRFGRQYTPLEAYRCDDARGVLITMGSMAGTAKHVVNRMREQGHPVGMVKIVSFRPFPFADLASVLTGNPRIGVIDRSAGLGAQGGPVWMEVKAAIGDPTVNVSSYIAGLGGRDIPEQTIETIFHQLLEGPSAYRKPWIDTRDHAMDIRPLHEI
ncbi:MAG: pyruvate ferredoxin oxidoreductase [Candidatus Omnitrophota bacterium]